MNCHKESVINDFMIELSANNNGQTMSQITTKVPPKRTMSIKARITH